MSVSLRLYAVVSAGTASPGLDAVSDEVAARAHEKAPGRCEPDQGPRSAVGRRDQGGGAGESPSGAVGWEPL